MGAARDRRVRRRPGPGHGDGAVGRRQHARRRCSRSRTRPSCSTRRSCRADRSQAQPPKKAGRMTREIAKRLGVPATRAGFAGVAPAALAHEQTAVGAGGSAARQRPERRARDRRRGRAAGSARRAARGRGTRHPGAHRHDQRGVPAVARPERRASTGSAGRRSTLARLVRAGAAADRAGPPRRADPTATAGRGARRDRLRHAAARSDHPLRRQPHRRRGADVRVRVPLAEPRRPARRGARDGARLRLRPPRDAGCRRPRRHGRSGGARRRHAPRVGVVRRRRRSGLGARGRRAVRSRPSTPTAATSTSRPRADELAGLPTR